MALELTTIDGWDFFDADDTDGASTFRIQVTQGTLTFTAGSSGVTASGSGTSDITLTGTMSQLNALFKSQTTGTLSYGTLIAGVKTFTIRLTDSNNLTDSDSFVVTAYVNAAPVVAVPPSTFSISIHGTASFDLTERPGWNFTDVDDTGGDDTLRIQVSQGTVDCTVGDSGVVITSGDATSNILLTGTLAELNALIKDQTTGTLVYSTSVAGVKTFTVTVTDTIGIPGVATFDVTATAPVPPVITPPSGTFIIPAVSTNFDLTEKAGWNITDPDNSGAPATLRIQVSGGTLDCTVGDSGLTITSGDVSSDILLTGVFPNFNRFLKNQTTGTLLYSPLIAGSKLFTATFTDPDGLPNAATFFVTATAPIPPVIVAGSTLQVDTGVARDLADAGFTVSDADDSFLPATCTLGITNGAITVTSGNSGVTITSGNGTNSVILSGTITSLNSLLNSSSSGVISYVAATSGSKTFTVTVVDSAGGSDSDTSSVVVGDRPVVTAPTLITTVQSVNKNLEGLGFTVTDADAAGTNTCVLDTTVGTIDLTVGNSGVTITADNAANVAFTGTIAQILSLLNDSSTGTIVWSPGASVTTGTIICTVVDSTGRSGAATGPSAVTTSAATWTGFVQCAPAAAVAALTDFYAPIDLSRFPTAWWDLVSVDGRDIRATLVNNVNIPRDLIRFDKVAKTGTLVVKFNHSTAPPAIRIHAGAPSATAPADAGTYGRNNTYASYVRGYWPDGAGEDRTTFNNDMSLAGGASAANTIGPFGRATSYDGINDRATANASVPTGFPYTLGAFVKANSISAYYTAVSVGSSATDTTITIVTDIGVGKVRAVHGREYSILVPPPDPPDPPATPLAQAFYPLAAAPGSVLAGAWTSVVGVFLSATSRYAVRDTSVGSNATSNGISSMASPTVSIGAVVTGRIPDGGNFFTGDIAHAFLWTNADAYNYVANFALTKDQATYWPTWAFTAESLTGL